MWMKYNYATENYYLAVRQNPKALAVGLRNFSIEKKKYPNNVMLNI